MKEWLNVTGTSLSGLPLASLTVAVITVDDCIAIEVEAAETVTEAGAPARKVT